MCTCNVDYSFTYKRATAEYLQAVNRCIKRATAVCTLLSTRGQPLNTYKRSTAASIAGNRCLHPPYKRATAAIADYLQAGNR